MGNIHQPQQDIGAIIVIGNEKKNLEPNIIYMPKTKYSFCHAFQRALCEPGEYCLILNEGFESNINWVRVNDFWNKFDKANVLLFEADIVQSKQTKISSFVINIQQVSSFNGIMVKKKYIHKIISSILRSIHEKISMYSGFVQIQKDETWFTIIS